jgi:N-acyl-L-homoserine lactone synthetase
MVRFIVGTRADLGDIYRPMGEFRYDVFVDELHWNLPDVNHEARIEVDSFDTDEAIYVVAVSSDELVVGCARLLPTIAPYLLGDIFSRLLPTGICPRSADIWEISRLAVRKRGTSPVDPDLAQQIFVNAIKVAASYGATTVVGVVSVSMERFYRRSGFLLRRIGYAEVVEGSFVTACAIDTDLSGDKRMQVLDSHANAITGSAETAKQNVCEADESTASAY